MIRERIMSYQIELSSKDVRIMALVVSIIPCLLFSAGFLTASLAQSSGHPQQAAALETASASTHIEASLPAQRIMETPIDTAVITEDPSQQLAMTPDEAQELPAPAKTATVSQLFSVQAAAFHDASNAINYAAQLKAKGYPTEVAILLETPDSPVYKVVYGSFALEEAAKAAATFTQQEKSPAFIVARS